LFDIVSKRKWFFLISGLVILIGIMSLIVSGLNLGIEFSSGSTMTLIFEEPVGQESLRSELSSLDHPEAVIQHSPKDAFLLEGLSLTGSPEQRTRGKEQLAEDLQSKFDTTIRMAEFPSTGNSTIAIMIGKTVNQDELLNELTGQGYIWQSMKFTTIDSFLVRTDTIYTDEEEAIKQSLTDKYGPVDSIDVYSISPEVASERVRYTGYAVIMAAIGILLYVTWAFRRLGRSIRYGVVAIIALLHDALIVLGVFSLFNLEVNSMFIIAILTVIGYSVNNTIVIFDRIRETRRRELGVPFSTIVNVSITETLGRSLNTSLTTSFVLLALALFGGSTISHFVTALLVGVIVGTYSSLLIATGLLISWDNGELGRLFNRIPIRRRES